MKTRNVGFDILTAETDLIPGVRMVTKVHSKIKKPPPIALGW
jgi:hypothetical protein